jgi:hypothetical protein
MYPSSFLVVHISGQKLIPAHTYLHIYGVSISAAAESIV